MERKILEQFEGYNDIIKDMEVCSKYGRDYSADPDSVEDYINLLHPPKIKIRIADIVEETSSTKTLRLVSQDHYLPPFQAGQYVALFLEIGGIRTSRPYSISSPPNQRGYYEITVRRVENGLVSNYLLDELKIGDSLESSGPTGNLYHNPLFHYRCMVCLAGGSGITPFMSMIREIIETGIDRTIYLFYGNERIDDVIFHDKLLSISNRFENIHYLPVIEKPPDGYKGHRGFITGNLIKEMLNELSDKTFYICGPQGMYDFCIPELEKLNIPRRKIRKEVSGTPINICQYPGWPEDVKGDDLFMVKVNGQESYKAKAGEALMVSLERNGVLIPSVCRSGECSICRVKILSGKVFMPSGVPIRKSDRQFGYIHSCVSYPITDMEILI